MLRLITEAHPRALECSIVASASRNPDLKAAARDAGAPFHHIQPLDIASYKRCFEATGTEVGYFFGRVRTIGWILAARLAGVPCLVGAERSLAREAKDKIGRSIDRWLLHAYIANSQAAASNLASWGGVSKNRVFVVPNGIPTSTARRLSRGSQKPYPSIVCVANILPNKNQMILLEAASILRKEFPEIKVRLVGQDFTGGRFQRSVDSRRMKDLVEFVGFTPDVDSELANGDIFVLPSLVREGTPTSILEAMQIGLPVVASRVGGIDEVVEDQVTGLLFEPNDLQGLVARLRWTLQNPGAAEEIAIRAKSFVRKHHSVEQMATAHVEVFRGLLAKP